MKNDDLSPSEHPWLISILLSVFSEETIVLDPHAPNFGVLWLPFPL